MHKFTLLFQMNLPTQTYAQPNFSKFYFDNFNAVDT